MLVTRLAFFWPGLASAWYKGQPSGLAFAVLFSWAICLLMLATFVWPEWISFGLYVFLWIGVIVFWVFDFIRTQFTLGNEFRGSGIDTTQALRTAQAEYLKGNWFEAEAQLLNILQRKTDDIVAGMLLVGVLRHTQRWKPALRRLDQLSLLDAALGWHFELAQEKKLIERAMMEARASDSESPGSQSGGAESSIGSDDVGVDSPDCKNSNSGQTLDALESDQPAAQVSEN